MQLLSGLTLFSLVLAAVALSAPEAEAEAATAYGNSARKCKCQPGQYCWPSTYEWNQLGTAVGGRLNALQPVAAVCHDPTFDEAKCTAAKAGFKQSVWRSAQQSAVQWHNWEGTPNETCPINTPQNTPCKQGAVPLYGVAAESASDIQKAVNFARNNNIPLVIKNTGHDFLGRSSPYTKGSLQIWTHKMKSMEFHDSFVPEGCSVAGEIAATIGAGVQVSDLYAAAAAKGRVVVAGYSGTVGAAGGYIQGGGHSPLANWVGMASDQALQFTIVTADGNHRTANACKNADLFWALRGGGGGTFGVVTSVTIRTHPDPPVLYASVDSVFPTANDDFYATIAAFHTQIPALDDLGGTSTYVYITPYVAGSGAAKLTTTTFFLNRTSSSIPLLNTTLAPYVDYARSHASTHTALIAPVSKMSSVFAFSIPATGDVVGENSIMGSRLISRAFLETSEGPARLTQAFRDLVALSPREGIRSHVMGGGKVISSTVDSAVNPAWRRTATHIVFTRNWADGTAAAEVAAIRQRMRDVEVPILEALEPDMGAYINEGDKGQKNFGSTYWGTNYGRLRFLKKKWDPKGVFRCRPCVGAEEYEENLICRK